MIEFVMVVSLTLSSVAAVLWFWRGQSSMRPRLVPVRAEREARS